MDIRELIKSYFIADCDTDTSNLALVQYHFSQGEHNLKIAPHGNSHSGQSYVQTMPGVMCKLKQEAKKITPKPVLQFVSSEAGGIMEATSAGALPRNHQQIKDANRNFDLLYCHVHVQTR